jgi:hypothetical protein
MDFSRPDAIERRQASHEHEVEAAEREGLLDHQLVGGRLDDALAACLRTAS